MFVRTRDAIEAHLTIVFTALAVAREAQDRTGLAIRIWPRTARGRGPPRMRIPHSRLASMARLVRFALVINAISSSTTMIFAWSEAPCGRWLARQCRRTPHSPEERNVRTEVGRVVGMSLGDQRDLHSEPRRSWAGSAAA